MTSQHEPGFSFHYCQPPFIYHLRALELLETRTEFISFCIDIDFHYLPRNTRIETIPNFGPSPGLVVVVWIALLIPAAAKAEKVAELSFRRASVHKHK